MNKKIISEEIYQFLTQEKHKPELLLLKNSPFEEVNSKEMAQQYYGLQNAKKKFPFLFENQKVIYPKKLHLEQASSQITAQYKSALLKGDTFVDLSMGMGIDAYFILKNHTSFIGIEPNKDLLEITQHNFEILGVRNAKFLNIKSEQFIVENREKFSTVYIDPSRRINSNKKFLIEELEPNILEIMDKVILNADVFCVKLSPLLDLHEIIHKLQYVHEIHIVAVKNDLKEILIILKKNVCSNPIIYHQNLDTKQIQPTYNFKDIKETKHVLYSDEKKYIYIPNVCLLKSKAHTIFAKEKLLYKLHPNTHIYTSDEIIPNFPGRIFEIKDMKPHKKQLYNSTYSIISKNYPLNVSEIKKKYKMHEGGTEFIIFTKTLTKKAIYICKPIS